MSNPIQFKLPYHISNNGDGSASVYCHPTRAAADKADEEMDEGWGEPCSGQIQLKVEDGKLYFQRYEYIDGKFQQVWIAVE